LEHVRVLHSPSGPLASGPPALVLVEAQNVSIRSCRFESPIRLAAERAAAPTAVAWRLVDRADPTAGRFDTRDVVFRGGREAVFVADGVRRISAENVLAIGQRSLFSLGAGGLAVSLKNLAIRDADAVVACREKSEPRRIEVTMEDSILDLGPTGALSTAAEIRWTGTGAFTVHDLAMADDASEHVEGITRANITFAGPATGSDAASVARVSGAPRVADRSVGIDLARLPREIIGIDGPR
jgi:hypothetical protein